MFNTKAFHCNRRSRHSPLLLCFSLVLLLPRVVVHTYIHTYKGGCASPAKRGVAGGGQGRSEGRRGHRRGHRRGRPSGRVVWQAARGARRRPLEIAVTR
eukprot:6722836-Prymnesium_polylepis.1